MGVLQYYVNVAEVIAGRQVTSISQEQSLMAARKLMFILLNESGGVNKEKNHKGAKLELAPNPDGALLKKAQKEDEAERRLNVLHELLAEGVVDIEPGTQIDDVRAFLTEGWFGMYIGGLPTCATIKAKNLAVDMTVRSVEATETNGLTKTLNKDMSEIQARLLAGNFRRIQIIAELGSRARITSFAKLCFCSCPSKEGVKEKEVIKLREILKVNLAMVFLISAPATQKGSGESVQEIMGDWLLQEAISTIEHENFGDPKLLERVEALKDFFLVFVGKPLELEDK